MSRPTTPADDAALHKALIVLALGLFARVALALILDPGLDEAYAVAVSSRWQLSWFDHPPMTFWWVAFMRELGTPLFGADVPPLWLRLPFLLAFTATSWLMFDLTRRLWGARAALWTLIALTLAPFFLVSAGSWMVPDGPLVLFLAATARLLVEILFFDPDPARERRLWLLAGLTLGLAGLSKYHAALFAFGALAYLLATPHRRKLATPGPWLAAGVALIVVAPVLIWNAENQWVSFLFQSSRGGGGRTNWPGFGRALIGQLAYLAPWTAAATLVATVRALRRDRALAAPSAFLVAVAVLPIVLFTLVPLAGGDSLPHWQMPGWLFLLPLFGRAMAEIETESDRLPRIARILVTVTIAVLAVAALAFLALRLAPPSRELATRLKLTGFLQESTTWRGLPEALATRGLLAPDAQGRPPVVVSFRWIEAARLGEALGPRATVAVFDHDPRGFAFLSAPEDMVGRDLVLLGRPDTLARGVAAVAPLFERIEAQPALALGPFDLDIAVGRHMLTPYALPYPKR